MSINQKALDQYFANHWNGGQDNWSITNTENIASKIKDDELVLDVGCGYNPFEGHIKHLYAFDPAINGGHELCTLEEFTTTLKFDVILCMGSINFGSREHIANQVKKIVSLLKPGGRIYWRQNPGNPDHGNKECMDVPFFPWDKAANNELAGRFGCYINDFQIDCHTKADRVRLYAEWVKS